MNILVLNAGSSSLKFRLFQIDELCSLSEAERVIAGGQVERIGTPDAQMTFFHGDTSHSEKRDVGTRSVLEAATEILRQLTEPTEAEQKPLTIDAVGHRIVHGGSRFFNPTLIDDAVLAEIQALTELAPLHNPSGLAGIEAVQSLLPSVPNVAIFDTAFHHDLPFVSRNYALLTEISERLQLRRYGFHGISYRFVSERLESLLKGHAQSTLHSDHFDHSASGDTRRIICHLGNGASICALKNGQSIDTSMGFTPLEGLIMGNRSGDVDPGLVLHLLRGNRMTFDEVEELLNHKSGLLGLSGKSGDMRDLEKVASEGDDAAELALACFAYRVRKYIGAYAAALGGVDTLVFTGGIGEHSAAMRARICEGLEFLGLYVNDERNQNVTGQRPTAISDEDEARVWVISTDEERQIARETFTLLS